METIGVFAAGAVKIVVVVVAIGVFTADVVAVTENFSVQVSIPAVVGVLFAGGVFAAEVAIIAALVVIKAEVFVVKILCVAETAAASVHGSTAGVGVFDALGVLLAVSLQVSTAGVEMVEVVVVVGGVVGMIMRVVTPGVLLGCAVDLVHVSTEGAVVEVAVDVKFADVTDLVPEVVDGVVFGMLAAAERLVLHVRIDGTTTAAGVVMAGVFPAGGVVAVSRVVVANFVYLTEVMVHFTKNK
ncbi:hypothetical protein HK100_004098 [Physocladia obscura]|uniref:Uncharacterized protein n=1 Tax=Physocladia obscura TaxID=109957 RepID=A0AAD5T859_9FUNG|nr:hypothetical protein HK100_004098 [Physocladia obscura]